MRDRNTDREKKIAEIREALEKATPGPWFLSESGFSRKRNCPTVYAIDEELRYIAFCDDRFNFTEETPNLFNAHLIANAPEWFEFLLDELDKRDEENRKLRQELEEAKAETELEGQIADDANSDLNEALEENEQLRQERDMYKSSSEVFYERLKKVAEQREKLVECLRFYERMARGREINDGGRRARTLLAEIGVTVE